MNHHRRSIHIHHYLIIVANAVAFASWLYVSLRVCNCVLSASGCALAMDNHIYFFFNLFLFLFSFFFLHNQIPSEWIEFRK